MTALLCRLRDPAQPMRAEAEAAVLFTAPLVARVTWRPGSGRSGSRGPARRLGLRYTKAIRAVHAPAYHGGVSTTHIEPELPPADRALVAAHADELRRLAAQYGITALRFASPGRLVGHVAEDRDFLDVVDFDVAARELLGAQVSLFSDAVLTKANVSPDLVAAEPL